MVAPVENRTMITGVVLTRKTHPAVDRWELITLAVDGTEPVPGFADLLTRRSTEQGGTIELAVEPTEAGPATVGRRIEVQATLAGPGVIRAVGPVRSSPTA